MDTQYLCATRLLNFNAPGIQRLVDEKGWAQSSDFEKILHVYNFVKNDIAFGYNADDAIPADAILKDGYGQCNTKALLAMALFRAVGIPCRFHGFTLDKRVQSGVLGVLYAFAPAQIIHSWTEVFYNGQWFQLEGLILDKEYLQNVQQKFQDCKGSFCGWGVGTDNLQNPAVEWNMNSTYIQRDGIIDDLGVFNTPDDFFARHSQKIGAVKSFLYRHFVRHYMNRNVKKMRNAKIL